MAPENTVLQKGESLSKICDEKFLGFKLVPREKLFKKNPTITCGRSRVEMTFFRIQVIKQLFVTRDLLHMG